MSNEVLNMAEFVYSHEARNYIAEQKTFYTLSTFFIINKSTGEVLR